MNVGEIYHWVTDQAKGHDNRPKYHVYMCEAGWRAEGYAFLFISKRDYGGDYLINRNDYSFLTFPTSYVSCGDIVTYTDDQLTAASPQFVGSLTKPHMVELRNAIAGSHTMTGWQITLCCGALAPALA